MSDLYKISGKVVKVDELTLSTDSSGNLETIRATDNEAIAGTDTNKALTPASGLALVTNQLDQRLTNALIYRGTWAITTETTDYSGLNSYRPIKAGDYFRITGTGPAIIDGVEYNPNDSIIFNQACSATTTITTAMIDHQDHTDASDTVYENATQTLTNKTIDADDNTISDLETDNFKSGVVVTSIGPSSGSDAATNNELPTALAVRSAINAATPSVDNVTIELGGDNNDTLQVKDQGISISKISSSALVLKTSESQSNATIPSYEKVSDMISSATPVVDGTTISLNTSSQLQADGLIEKNQSNAVYDWVGTYAEYQAAKQNNQILDSWICFITDDSFVADPNKIVMTDTAQTITGNKSFTGTVQVPTSSDDVGTSTEAVNVKYLYDEGYSALRSNTANIDLSNLSSTGEAHFANPALTNSPYTTNRILEIPQDIKLELNNGTLTLKAGSKVYVPNGFEADGTTPKFDEFITSNDIVDHDFGNTSREFTFLITNDAQFSVWPGANIVSGTSVPDFSSLGYWGVWYDTANNIIKTQAGTNEWIDFRGFSLPFSLVSSSSSAVTSIDQIFNGFGYIGSTVFALPGVKVQTPNGRNEDGTYRITPYSTQNVITREVTGTGVKDITIQPNGVLNWATGGVYLAEDGYLRNHTDGNINISSVLAQVLITTAGKIDNFIPRNVDSVVNSNASNFSQAGRSYLSGLGIPTHINGRLVSNSAASETDFVAPCNGIFKLNGLTTNSGKGYCQFYNVTQYNATSGQVFMQYGGGFNAASSGQFYRAVGAVKKGDVIRIQYSSNVAIGGEGYGEGLFFLPFEGEN